MSDLSTFLPSPVNPDRDLSVDIRAFFEDEKRLIPSIEGDGLRIAVTVRNRGDAIHDAADFLALLAACGFDRSDGESLAASIDEGTAVTFTIEPALLRVFQDFCLNSRLQILREEPRTAPHTAGSVPRVF